MSRSQDEGISQMPTGSIPFEIVFCFAFVFYFSTWEALQFCVVDTLGKGIKPRISSLSQGKRT